ncbi:stress protein [Peribacillus saganii]|uniref:Stress protein n=1 Tax=Peribacillus saganii TaxID=2303992 RepID=A0A372LNC9_9BACI|nr:VWA domain-containing protein [Peribacillus saganii]RFU69020.1 stress protein [Peribacillus saganii]
MTHLVKGQRLNLTQQFPDINKLTISISWEIKPGYVSSLYDMDVSVFMLNEQRKIPAEEYFVFYNNAKSPDNALYLSGKETNSNQQTITINFAEISKEVSEMVFVLTIHDADSAQQDFSHLNFVKMSASDSENNQQLFTFVQDQFTKETACELASLYRKDSAWRFNPVGQGYHAGLQEFLHQYHDEATAEEPAAQHTAIQEAAEPVMLSKLDLLKKKVDVVILKKSLQKTTARVGVVLDISGSMRTLYNNGTVQNVVERLLALATRFDNDGVLDAWVYDVRFSRLPSITEATLPDFVNREILNNKSVSKFRMNNEPPVMRDVLQKYLKEESSSLPVYLIFINDGGIKRSARGQDSVTSILKESSDKPIFWQFVGIGNGNFDVLRKLDELKGRYIDNANFFHILDIEKETDEELYEKLLNEFPEWLREAKKQNVIR